MTGALSTPSPLSAQRQEWRRFWKIVFFATILPFLILIGALEGLGWSLGDTYTPRALVRALEANPNLIWMGVHAHAHARLKLAQIAAERPEVLVMGTSRLGRVRAGMFAPYSFYNLARVSWPFDSYVDIMRHFPAGYRPKVILFTVDFFMFTPGYQEHLRDTAPVFDHDFSEHLIELHNVATQLLQRPQLIWKRTDPQGRAALGISAIRGDEAFFKDGSERPPLELLAAAGRSPQDIMKRPIRQYVGGGPQMAGPEMASLKQFADLAREKGIPLVGVAMPIYGPALRMLEQDPDYRIIQDFRNHVAQGYFEKMGILFYDLSTLPPYSEDYRYFFDGVHPGWPLTTAAIQALGSDPRFHALLPRLDMAALQSQLNADRQSSQHILQNQ